MENSDVNFENRLYLLLIIGSPFDKTLEQLETLKNTFLEERSNNVCYGNSILFVSDENVPTLGKEVKKDLGESLGHMIIDVTDNLNPYDFIANITENHSQSKELVGLIKDFLQKQVKEEQPKPLSLEEQLKCAIEVENFKEAARLRDEINSKKESV